MKDRCFFRKIGQDGIGTLEYALLLFAFVVALIIVQTPLRRAFCSRWKSAADQIGFGRQYDQGSTTIVSS